MDTMSMKIAVTMAFAEFTGEIRNKSKDEAQHLEMLETIHMLLTRHIDCIKKGVTPLEDVMARMKTTSQADGAVDSISDTPL